MTELKFDINYSLIEEWLTQESKKSQIVDKEAKAILLNVLEIFKEVGPITAREKLPRSRTKYLFDDIWEIRIYQYRIAYFWDDAVCVLLHGFKKKTDKWPLRAIKLVKTRKKNYFENK
jgi:mRNA-degrading endonuclease RelE of RelBE toxin-antitoxin system